MKLHRVAFMGVEVESTIPPELMAKILFAACAEPEFMQWWNKEAKRQQAEWVKRNPQP